MSLSFNLYFHLIQFIFPSAQIRILPSSNQKTDISLSAQTFFSGYATKSLPDKLVLELFGLLFSVFTLSIIWILSLAYRRRCHFLFSWNMQQSLPKQISFSKSFDLLDKFFIQFFFLLFGLSHCFLALSLAFRRRCHFLLLFLSATEILLG